MRYLLLTFLGLLLFLGFSITPSSAAELNNEEIVVDRANYNSELDFENAVNSYMNDENILTVTVIDSNRTIEESLGVQPMRHSYRMQTMYFLPVGLKVHNCLIRYGENQE